MKLFALVISAWFFTGCVHAQEVKNTILMKKPNAAASTPRIDFFENTNTYAVHVHANGTALSSNLNFIFPYNSDTAGDCLVSGGSGQWNPGSCSLAPPVVLSGSSASPILTVTQTGAGLTARLDGNTNVGYADGAFFSVDASGSGRLGMTKRVGAIPQLTYGSGNNFEITESNATDIGPGNSFSPRMTIGTNGDTQFYRELRVLGGISYLQALQISTSAAGTLATIQNSGTGNGLLVVGGSGGFGLFVSGGSILDSIAVSSTATLSGSTVLNGSVSGTHGQNIGAADSPSFSSLTVPSMNFNGSAGSTRGPIWTTSGLSRWAEFVTGSEPGSNAGADWALSRYNDAGTFVGTVMSAVRSTGVVSIPNLRVDSFLTGTHAQAVGLSDAPSFQGMGMTGNLNITSLGGSLSVNGAMNGTHGQNIGTGDSPTFNTITASVNSNLGIAAASSLGLTGALSVGSGAATIDSFGVFSGTAVSTSGQIAAGNFITAGTFIGSGSSYGFKVGGTSGLSFGSVQTLTVRNSAGTGTCTISVIGGIVSATTC